MSRIADPLAKAKLLRAARTVFAQHGLAEARIEDIAREAGLGKGSFYLHFKSKDQAFEEVCDAFFVDVQRLVEDGCQLPVTEIASGDTLRACLREMDALVLDFLWQHRDVLKMIYSSASMKYAHLLDAMMDVQSQMVTENVRAFQQRGLYNPAVDAEAVGWLMMGSWHAIGRRIAQAERKPDFRAWIEAMHVLWLDGLLRR